MKNFIQNNKVLLGIVLSVLFTCLIFFYVNNNKNKEYNEPIENSNDTITPMTLDNVLIEICKNDIKFPLVVFRQVIVETMWLQCQNCSLDVNNLFGMGWNGKTYFKYKDWKESIKSYKAWQDTTLRANERDYYEFLKRVKYATAERYIEELKAVDLP